MALTWTAAAAVLPERQNCRGIDVVNMPVLPPIVPHCVAASAVRARNLLAKLGVQCVRLAYEDARVLAPNILGHYLEVTVEALPRNADDRAGAR